MIFGFIVVAVLSGPAHADVAIPGPPTRGQVAEDLPAPDAPSSGPPPAAIAGGVGALVGLGILGVLVARRWGR